LGHIEKHDADYVKVLVCMLLGSIVTFAVLYAPQPLITVFAKQYGVSPSTASASISRPTLALAVSLLFVPALSRRIGRKRIMGFSLFATSVLAIVSGFSHTFEFFLAIRLLEGIALSGFPAIAIAYLNEEIAPGCIGGAMGAYVAGTAVGGFIGRVAIGPLTEWFSWQVAFLVLGVVCLLCSAYFWMSLPRPRNFKPARISLPDSMKALGASLRRRELLLVYGMAFLAMGSYIMLLNYVGYPLTEAPYRLSQTALGSLFVVNLLGVGSSILFGRLADRYSRPALMGVACLIFASGALLTLAPNLVVKIIGIAVFALGFFATHTTASGWVGVAAPADRKATASSLYLIFYYGGSSVVGWAGGYVWAGFQWPGLIGAVCLLIGACYGLSVVASRGAVASPVALRS
jgi:MFS transporter, YNFM family, putative membrane transport protein